MHMTSHEPIASDLPSTAADLLHVLDRELTCTDLDTLPREQLRRLAGLLEHWHQLADLRLHRRAEEEG
jgi:hypothetical protein